MKQNDLLFVYGTLRRGEHADLSTNRKVVYRQTSRINGLLYHLGSYPGARELSSSPFDPSMPSIVGDVFRIRDESITPILDAYEGYPVLYGRRQVTTDSGLLVWVYDYVPVPLGAVPLKGGNWVTGKLASAENLGLKMEMSL